MGQYSIKDIEEITSIKAHTIRIWEKRYNIVTPKRTDTNIRYYTDADLKRLLSISTLNNHGKKISHLAQMSDAQISKEIEALSDKTTNAVTERLKLAMLDFDEERFSKVFDDQVSKLGLEKTITDIVYPFFEIVGNLWLAGSVNPAQEHFVSNLIRQKLYRVFDELPNGDKKHVLVFLLEGEWHDIGILFYSVLLKMYGFKVTYLGQSCPKIDASTTIKQLKPDYCLTAFISTEGLDNHKEALIELSEAHKTTQFILSGYLSEQLDKKLLPKNTKIITSTKNLKML